MAGFEPRTSRIWTELASLFCSTGLPLARTRWGQTTFSSHCLHSSNQRHWLTSATSVMFPQKTFQEHWESNLWLLVEKQVCYLCAMQPPPPPANPPPPAMGLVLWSRRWRQRENWKLKNDFFLLQADSRRDWLVLNLMIKNQILWSEITFSTGIENCCIFESPISPRFLYDK